MGQVSAVGINLMTVDTRVVVASLDACVTHAEAVRSILWFGVPLQGHTRSGAAADQRAAGPELPASEAMVRAVEDYLGQLAGAGPAEP